MRTLDLVGQSFGKLTVVARSTRQCNSGALWECLCVCGKTSTVNSLKLRNGLIVSCGCHRKGLLNTQTHGKSKTKTYRSWKEMRQRCNNPNSDKWQRYGGRGISVCSSWDDYEVFLDDMGTRPDGKTIDRINSDGNYEKSNCRWATAKEQAETNRGCYQKGSTKVQPL